MKQYYNHKGITIYHGDCKEIMPDLEPVDLVVTDPPYDIKVKGGKFFGAMKHFSAMENVTDMGCDYSFLDNYKDWICFCSLKQVATLLGFAGNERKCLITWCKTNPVPLCGGKYLPDVEYIVHSWSKKRLFGNMSIKSCFVVSPVTKKETNHPNEKPNHLMSKLIQLGSEAGDSILDPFAGSGTTLVVAKELGRKAVGIELEEKYCEIAARRLRQEVLFGI